MKYILSILCASILVFACDKIEDPAPINTIDTSKTATITGTVTTQLDLSNSTTENVPAGTVLFFTVNASDYVVNGTATGTQKLVYTTAVEANGTYTIAIPALTKAISVSITGDEFAFNQKQSAGPDIRKVYKINTPASPSITLGKKTVLDLSYTGS